MKKSLLILLTLVCHLVVFNNSFSQSINLKRGLIAHFPFNGDAKDASGNSNDGIVKGAVVEPARCGDLAFSFDGEDDYIDCGNNDVLNGNFPGLTVSVWVNFRELRANDFGFIVGKWAFKVDQDHFGLFINPNRRISFAVGDKEEIGYGVYSNSQLDTHEWYHVVAVWNRSRKVGIFINGKLDKMGTQHGDGINSNSPITLKIGRQVVRTDRAFKGFIDEVRIYNRSLSFEEIEALYKMENTVCNQLIIEGTVLNANTYEPLEADISFEDLETGKKVFSIKSDKVTGRYQAYLPIGFRYGFYAKAQNFISVNENLNAKNVAQNTTVTKDLYLVPIEVGESVRLNNINFEFGKATLTPDSFAELDRLIQLLNEVPTMRIEIGGHTDDVGSDDYNLKLSNDRANAVKDYLLSKAIDPGRIEAKGYGETMFVSDNLTEEGRATNRRVEFLILEK